MNDHDGWALDQRDLIQDAHIGAARQRVLELEEQVKAQQDQIWKLESRVSTLEYRLKLMQQRL